MRRITKAFLGIAATALSLVASSSYADELLGSFGSRLYANRNYETGMVELRGARFVRHVTIKSFGANCRISGRSFEVISAYDGRSIMATSDGAGGYNVNAEIFAFNYRLAQLNAPYADCKIEVWSDHQPAQPPVGDLLDQVQTLSSHANLLGLTVRTTPGYESLDAQARELSGYVNYLRDSVQAGQDRRRINNIFTSVRQQTDAFEAKLVPIHTSIQNKNVDDAWQVYVKALDSIRIALLAKE